jgi:hypothetical protein
MLVGNLQKCAAFRRKIFPINPEVRAHGQHTYRQREQLVPPIRAIRAAPEGPGSAGETSDTLRVIEMPRVMLTGVFRDFVYYAFFITAAAVLTHLVYLQTNGLI